MQISKDLVASIHYTLKNADGEVLDTSEGQEPLHYVHGAQNIVPGLEKELEGKTTGDKLSVAVEPIDGYGEYNAELIQELPKDMFAGVDTIEVGMEFQAQTPEGGMQIIEVKSIDGDKITVDGNHPMAGQTLHFDVEITDVREATKDELEHGHVHSEGCDH
ncbi:FKBP-type peptidyl-prolyl cis-trans isomerase SlyD [gamma proteobacterium IMCC1989]|nr:FKBP-type peptidyl-prolyl cis-trans isomerase SlyD [gamma proteobacterium IMCC1989]